MATFQGQELDDCCCPALTPRNRRHWLSGDPDTKATQHLDTNGRRRIDHLDLVNVSSVIDGMPGNKVSCTRDAGGVALRAALWANAKLLGLNQAGLPQIVVR